jgi:predicted MFS family arabinose efflux permease
MHRHPLPFDLIGAGLVCIGLAGLLVAISESTDWGWGSRRLLLVTVISLVIIGGWVAHELRTHLPLVDLRLMRHRTLLTANVTGVMAGCGMYMLLSMIIRYVQTPTSISYGLGASILVSGLVLTPLSASSFLASKGATYLGRWISPSHTLPLGVLAFAAALTMFATARNALWEVFIVMTLAGAGIGSSFAVMPRMIVSSTVPEETASALALNQVLRTVGFSIGSALSATVLAEHTPLRRTFPLDVGYTDAAFIATGLLLLTAVVGLILPSREERPAVIFDADQNLLVEESVDGAIAGVVAFEPQEEPPDGGEEIRDEAFAKWTENVGPE